MVLYEAVADFVGLLEVALVVLAIKELIGIFSGNGGGGGGSLGGAMKAFEKAGEVADAGRRQIWGGEKKEAVEESAEEKEEKRQFAYLARIQKLTQYGINDAAGMKAAIGTIINLIKSTKGRLSTAVQPEVEKELQVIGQKSTEIQNVTRLLEQTIADLENVEREEVILAQRAATDARTAVENAMRTTAGRVTRPQIKKLTMIQQRIENDIRKRAANKWATTKKNLESDRDKIRNGEVEFGKLVHQAMSMVNPSRYNDAINLLNKANEQLTSIEYALKTAGTTLVDKIRREITAELKDLKVEKNLIARIKLEMSRP